jgi:hypothetical protein
LIAVSGHSAPFEKNSEKLISVCVHRPPKILAVS